MFIYFKKASKSLSDAILPKPNPRKVVKARSVQIVPTRKIPPVLRSRRLQNGSNESSTENGDTDSFVYLPAKREYDLYSDSEDEEFRPKVYKLFYLFINYLRLMLKNLMMILFLCPISFSLL